MGQQHLLSTSATSSPATTRLATQAAQPAPLAAAAGQALQPAAPPLISTTPGQMRDLRVGHGMTSVCPSPLHTSRLAGPVRRAHSLEILEYALYLLHSVYRYNAFYSVYIFVLGSAIFGSVKMCSCRVLLWIHLWIEYWKIIKFKHLYEFH